MAATDRSGAGRFPTASLDGPGALRLSWRLGPDAGDAGIVVAEEWSSDLLDWNAPPPAGLVRNRSGDEIVLTAPLPAGSLFLRLRVALPE